MKSSTSETNLVVGVGASAGGLSVLKALMRALPEDTKMSFIIIQHLAPNHKSLLTELLTKETTLPVEEARDGQRVAPGHCYVIPPNTYLELAAGKLRLTEPDPGRGGGKAVDYCFHSLARECGGRAAGIILSGAGNDGTAGLRAIRAAGGLALAQPPASAEHSSMPASAINAGVVDKVVEIAEMPAILQQFADHNLSLAARAEISAEESLEAIATLLAEQEHFNIRQYKSSTLQRRIARRVSLTNSPSYAAYLELLHQSGGERQHLMKDFMINVTGFFRDPEVFELLENELLPALIASLQGEETIRVWVPGCASGEEAYTIAILLAEAVESAKTSHKIKVFGTDIDAEAISIARKGIYPASIATEIPADYLDKYFTDIAVGQQYRIQRNLRDMISFAVQNVTADPPFSHIHLISCRNLLIYLKKEMQERVINAFYFALQGPSYLILGNSETVGSQSNRFNVISKKSRIYQKIPGRIDRTAPLGQSADIYRALSPPAIRPAASRQSSRTPNRNELLRQAVLDAVIPAMVVVDAQGHILYNHGQLMPYVTIPPGEPRNDITQLVLPELRARIRAGLFKMRTKREKVSFHCLIPATNRGETATIGLRVEMMPIELAGSPEGNTISIIFYEAATLPEEYVSPALNREDDNYALQQMELELAETKAELQQTIEELEISTEELKASHEEALSTNEELQSANEELEASSEELRSLNEELSAVNAQLKEKIAQLQVANNDVENFFTSTNVPTVFLNPDLEIQRYTPAAEQLLKMGPRDIGRPVSSLGRDLIDAELEQECQAVLQSFQPRQKEIQIYSGRCYLRQISPYRTDDRRVEGVVLLFQDITEIKELSRRAEIREQQQFAVARLGMLALSGVAPEELMDQAVRQIAHVLDADYCKVLKYQPEQKNLLLLAGVGWQGDIVGKATVPDDQDSQAGYTLLSQEPVIVRRLSEERRFCGPDLLVQHQVISGISCVINHSTPPYGVLGVHTRNYREFTDDDANFLLSVANLLSTALHTQRTHEKLYESELQFRTLANSIPQLAWMADATGYIYWYNQRWYDYTGASLEEMEGWGWQKIHRPGLVDKITDKYQRHVEMGEEWEDTFPLRSSTGEYRWFLSRAQPIRNSQGEVIRWFGTNTDITRQLEYEQALRESEEKLRIAMDTNRLGAFEYYIESGEIVWDELIRNIWGVKSDEATTFRRFLEGVHPDDRENVLHALKQALDTEGDGYYHAVYRVHNKGEEHPYWVETSGQVFQHEGKPQKMIGLVIDITERKHLEASLRSAIAELEVADKQKNDFLAILGHELRNPLAALRGSVELMERGISLSPELLSIMQGSIKTMAKLLDDLLDLSRMSRNRIQLDLQRVEIGAVLEAAILGAQALRTEKQQELHLQVEEGLTLMGDPTRLEQIFSNLLVNASKYSPPGSRIELIAQAEADAIVVSVLDEGEGIEDAALQRIFDPFYQVAPNGKAASGLGIGLALAKDLTERHGGSIRAFSDGPGRGACFEVRFPLLIAGEIGPTVVDSPGAARAQTETVVVLVEDNPDVRITFSQLLQGLQCEVHTAENGNEGLRLILEHTPAAALIDIGLPDMNGYEVARQLRAAGYDNLLVAVSGYSHSEAREKSLAAGFDHHLAKPATVDDVANLLTGRISRNGGNKQAVLE